jgi:hypothetical protein
MQNKNLYLLSSLLIFSLLYGTNSAQALEKCNFSRDLENGAVGEDVRCLQKYLNGSGYKISDSGVGSPGNETNLFKDKTVVAVKK